MATLQGLQKAIDTKSFNPNDLTEDQLLVIDDLLKTGELKGYKSIDEIITERSGAASAIAGEKQKKLQPFQQATKEAGFEVERADLELVGDVSLGAYAWLQDKDKLVNSLKKGMGAVEFGVNREALNFRTGQWDKYEKLLSNMPVVRNIKPFSRLAGVVGKMADGFRQIRKAGPTQFMQTELKSIAYGTGGAGIGSLTFDAANYATDFTAASSMDLAELTDDDVAKLPPGQREAYHALEAMNNAMVFNAGAAALGPLLQLAGGGVKKVLGLSTPEVEQLARYTKETGVPTNLFALADPNAGFLARGMKNILNVVGIFPATAGPGIKYKTEIEQETFKSMLDHLNAGAPYAHAELLSLGSLNQMKQNFRQYMDTIGLKYDVVFKEADLLGPEMKIIPIQNLSKATENLITSLKAQYPGMDLQMDKRVAELTEFDDPLVKFIAATKEYTNNLTEGLTAKEYVGLNKMLTAAYNQTKLYDPRGLVAQMNHALKADFNTVAEAPSIKVLMNDNKQIKEAYENVVKSQGEEGANLYVQNLIGGVKNVQKSLIDANDFFTRTIRRYQKSPVAGAIRKSDSNLFTNVGLLGVGGKYSVQPDELWSKTLKQVFRNGSKDSIEEMKFLLGYNKEGPGKEIFDRFKQLYMFDAFTQSFDVAPYLKGEPTFELMAKARESGVIMKSYVDDITKTLTGELDVQKFVDPKALIKTGLGEQKFLDMKVQADKVAGFNPVLFEENLGLAGRGIGAAEQAAARDRLIAMYGGGVEGKKGFEQLNKIIALMKANASYGISDTSTFVKRRAALGGIGAIAGGVLPFAAAGSVGLVPTLAFVFLSRFAGSVLSNPKSVEVLFDVLNPTLKIEKGIAGKLDLSKKRIFAALLNASLDEDKDAPKVDPDLINAKEITDYLLRKAPQIPNAKFKLDGMIKSEKDRMYPEIRALSRSPAPELAGGENFVRGAALAKQQDDMITMLESQIPEPTSPRQLAMQQLQQAQQRLQGQQPQQPMIPQVNMQQPTQTQAAKNPALFRALNPQDTLGQAIVERQAGTV